MLFQIIIGALVITIFRLSKRNDAREIFDILYNTFRRDTTSFLLVIRFILLIRYEEFKGSTVISLFSKMVQRTPNKVILESQYKKWTFKQLDDFSDRIAWHFLSKTNLEKGTTVAIYISNDPEFVGTWLGLTKIGFVGALINQSQRLKPLSHSILASKAKAIITDTELLPHIRSLFQKTECNISEAEKQFTQDELNQDITSLPLICIKCSYSSSEISIGAEHSECKENNKNITCLDFTMEEKLEQKLKSKIQSISNSIRFNDTLFYIYTSGTTGLPKPAIIKHSKFILASIMCKHIIGMREPDVLYTAGLPLCHTLAGMVALSGSICRVGYRFVIRKKFSSENFWKDCRKHNVTVAIYIGELCRYLLGKAPSFDEKQHSLRLMFGNGLHKDIWSKFVARFRVPSMIESYASTEGNCNLANISNKIGAVGSIPPFLSNFMPFGLIKVNEATGEPERDEDGFCIRCKPGEPGEFVAKIVDQHPVRGFPGYVNNNATKNKIIRHVWSKDDQCFKSGDILVTDKYGWFYYIDRIGDTFRWKGENVSTAEVESVINSFDSSMIQYDVIMYGIRVPGYEGRAGMLALRKIDGNCDIDLIQLSMYIQEHLPKYARPLFLRIVKHPELWDLVTTTMKLRKSELQRAGYKICRYQEVRDNTGSVALFNEEDSLQDQVYFLNPTSECYEKLTPNILTEIENGKIVL